MGIFEPHFYVTEDKFGQWTNSFSYQINEEFSAGEILSRDEYNLRAGTSEPRLMYSFVEKNEVPHMRFDADEWPNCPPMWYAFAIIDNGVPPNITAYGFITDDFEPGRVVSAREAADSGVSPHSRIAAIQWGYKDPKIFQIYVHDDWRRRRIAGAMIGVADMINLAGNFSPGVLVYGGDITTKDGDHILEAWSKSPRAMQKQGGISNGGERGI